MYLNRLSNEQKELFLDLCIHASMSNNDFDEKEKEYIRQYCEEMQLDNVRYTAENELDAAVEKMIKISSETELKIVILELTALLLSDNEYDEMEKQFMEKMLTKASISSDVNNQIIASLKKLTDIYSEINSIIFS
ncbi:MAG: hypothetical protein NC253_15245 [Ruminococcus sp.]|nr:hypothetical protein [Ruminococcus sp.]MCM1480417.1 hypothetical protein [Muribaculaceae bacterium]